MKTLLNYWVSVYVMARAGRVKGPELRNGLQRGSATEKLKGSEEGLGPVKPPHSTPEEERQGSEWTPSSLICQDFQVSLGNGTFF